MEFYEGQEEMVAGPCDHHLVADRNLTCIWWRFSARAFYLYFILMNRTKHLETILVLVLALLVCYFIFDHTVWLKVAIALGAIGLFLPYLAGKIHWLWMKLAHVLGYVMSRVLLPIIFFVILVPLAFFSRLAGKNTVQLKRTQGSYFRERNFRYNRESLENVW